MVVNERLYHLFTQYVAGHATEAEVQEFFAMADMPEHEAAFQHLMEITWTELEEMEEVVKQPKPKIVPLYKRVWFKVASIAAVLLIGIFTYNYLQQPSGPSIVNVPTAKNDVDAGSNKAVLTLANGQKIILDSTKGTISKQGNVTVINLNGQLSYEANEQKLEVAYNTISTPKGGQYQLILADGTKVWLNAASSLKYPTAFIGSIREVELIGEGYFEVAPLALKGGGKMPFHVKASGQDVEVLGTHFNINAYSNEAYAKTTLLEGSVKVKSEVGSKKSLVLKPGQQSTLRQAQGDMQLIEDADTEQAVAWKNGMTIMESADIAAIMREVERWYDVDVEIRGNMPQRSFHVEVSRSASLSKMLKVFDANGIHYTLDAVHRKLTVIP